MRRDGLFFRWGLALATLLAAALRFAWLGSVPAALYCDEALHGYEAWSLLTTGRDRRGVLLPFFFDVFGVNWSEPLYIYLTVPAVGLFGVTPLAARFVAAAAGTLAVPVAGLMTRALLSGRHGHAATGSTGAGVAGVAAAFLMATSPWAVHFSRIAFQASLLPLLLGAAFWLASTALRREDGGRMRLAAAAVCLGLTFHTYPAARVATPLLAAAFAWTHRSLLPRRPAVWIPALALLAALVAPVAWFSFTDRGWRRFSDVSLVATMPDASWAGRAGTAARHYLSYYSPAFLLLEGDPNPRHGVPGHGVLHPHEALLLAAGIVFCLRARTPGGLFLTLWAILFPVAAALTIDPRHAVRSLVALPGLYALAGAGLIGLWSLRRASSRGASLAAAAALVVLGLVGAWGAGTWLRDYFIRWPISSAPAFQYGLRETYDYLSRVQAGHDSIYVTLNEDYPWIQLLYYQKIPPERYQRRQLEDTPYLFGEKVFYKGDRIPGRSHPIFVWKPWEVPSGGVTVRETIRYPDGSPAFVIAW